MAKVYVVNPRRKKKRAPSAKPKVKRRRPNKKPKVHRRRPNPLEMVITGAGINPHRKGKNKMAAKRKHRKARSTNPRRKSHVNRRARHNRRHRNPLLPVEARRLPGLILGGAAGGIGAVWIPSLLLPNSDVGFFGYLMNAVVAVLGAWGLGALNMPNLALGWLIGGAVAVVGRVIDDFTGKQVIQFNAPMGQFYRQFNPALPGRSQSDLTDYQQQAVLASPVPAPGTGVVHTAGSVAMAKKTGMGWSYHHRT